MHTNRKADKDRMLTEKDFLYIENRKILTKDKRPVMLRGTNLGGWLIQEAWMCPLAKEDKGWGAWDTLHTLEQRGFTEAQILQIMHTYEANWITVKDLDRIKEMGFTCVRVPFWYRNFQKDDKGAYYAADHPEENPGFKALDWIVEECGKRDIYVILDMHGAPGFQSDDHCCGKSHSSLLFDDTEEGRAFRALTIEFWQRIAARYAGNPTVAAYDLLNEPMNGFADSRKNDKVIWEVYNEIYQAVRKIDKDHIITVEGIWELDNLPDPAAYGWENVLYQTHNYNWDHRGIDGKIADVKKYAHWNVPVYVGEFQSDGIWDYALEAYNNAEMHWTTWNYKGAKSTLDGWFIYKNTTIDLVDPENDSFEEMLDKWSRVNTDSTGFVRDEGLASILTKYAEAGRA